MIYHYFDKKIAQEELILALLRESAFHIAMSGKFRIAALGAVRNRVSCFV
jgi:hypothetical protein